MPINNRRVIHSISTGPQPSDPLPKDTIIGPAAGSSGAQYIQRRRYLYRWPNRQERNLDRIRLYQGTITPSPSQIRFYRNRKRRVVAIFEHGHDIEPPLIGDSEIPHATIITTREFLCDIPPLPLPEHPTRPSDFSLDFSSSCTGGTLMPSHTQSATNDRETTTGTKRRRETNDDERRDHASKRPKSAGFSASPILAFAFGVAVGAFNSNIIGRVCELYT